MEGAQLLFIKVNQIADRCLLDFLDMIHTGDRLQKVVFVKRIFRNDSFDERPTIIALERSGDFLDGIHIHTICMQIKEIGPQIDIVICTGDEIFGSVLILPFEIAAHGGRSWIGWVQS